MNVMLRASLLLALSLWVSLAAGAGSEAITDSAWNSGRNEALRARLDAADDYSRSPERIRDTLPPPQWLRDGKRFVYWGATGMHAGTWVMVNADDGVATPLIAPERLRSELARLGGVANEAAEQPPFAFAPDQQRLLFRHHQRTYALSFDAPRLEALAAEEPLALGLMPGNHWAPDGAALAVARGDGFALLDRSGRERAARVAAEDEAWEIPEQSWSPDSRTLALWRVDNHGVHKLPVVDTTGALEKVTQVPYAKVGTALPRRTLYFADAVTGELRPVLTVPADDYAWLAAWRPGSKEALVVVLSRDGKRLDLVAVDAGGQSRRVLREERPQSFVGGLDFALEGWSRQVFPLADGRQFVWMSERDGWRHAYLYRYDGSLVRQLTRGDFVVHQVLAEIPGHARLLVIASTDPGAPYDRVPYSIPMGGGRMTRLAADGGSHRLFPSPSGRYAVDGHSSRTQPRVWDVLATDGSRRQRYAEADISALAALGYRPPESITALAADGSTRLYGVLYKPADFDSRKRYPVIDCIYAGPFITAVPWSYVGSSSESRIGAGLAQLGFVVVLMDARGTPGRSKAFQDANYGRIGQTEIPDHVAALKQLAAERPYLDLERVGIVGHSWGGYFALRGMLTAPDFFKAGYAGAPGALEEEAIINEPYLGLPGANPSGYREGSNMLSAENLRGALRIMHGTADINAPFSTTLRMVDALIKAGKRFELLVMPGEQHSPSGMSRRYRDDDVRLFFLRTLGTPR